MDDQEPRGNSSKAYDRIRDKMQQDFAQNKAMVFDQTSICLLKSRLQKSMKNDEVLIRSKLLSAFYRETRMQVWKHVRCLGIPEEIREAIDQCVRVGEHVDEDVRNVMLSVSLDKLSEVETVIADTLDRIPLKVDRVMRRLRFKNEEKNEAWKKWANDVYTVKIAEFVQDFPSLIGDQMKSYFEFEENSVLDVLALKLKEVTALKWLDGFFDAFIVLNKLLDDARGEMAARFAIIDLEKIPDIEPIDEDEPLDWAEPPSVEDVLQVVNEIKLLGRGSVNVVDIEKDLTDVASFDDAVTLYQALVEVENNERVVNDQLKVKICKKTSLDADAERKSLAEQRATCVEIIDRLIQKNIEVEQLEDAESEERREELQTLQEERKELFGKLTNAEKANDHEEVERMSGVLEKYFNEERTSMVEKIYSKCMIVYDALFSAAKDFADQIVADKGGNLLEYATLFINTDGVKVMQDLKRNLENVELEPEKINECANYVKTYVEGVEEVGQMFLDGDLNRAVKLAEATETLPEVREMIYEYFRHYERIRSQLEEEKKNIKMEAKVLSARRMIAFKNDLKTFDKSLSDAENNDRDVGIEMQDRMEKMEQMEMNFYYKKEMKRRMDLRWIEEFRVAGMEALVLEKRLRIMRKFFETASDSQEIPTEQQQETPSPVLNEESSDAVEGSENELISEEQFTEKTDSSDAVEDQSEKEREEKFTEKAPEERETDEKPQREERKKDHLDLKNGKEGKTVDEDVAKILKNQLDAINEVVEKEEISNDLPAVKDRGKIDELLAEQKRRGLLLETYLMEAKDKLGEMRIDDPSATQAFAASFLSIDSTMRRTMMKLIRENGRLPGQVKMEVENYLKRRMLDQEAALIASSVYDDAIEKTCQTIIETTNERIEEVLFDQSRKEIKVWRQGLKGLIRKAWADLSYLAENIHTVTCKHLHGIYRRKWNEEMTALLKETEKATAPLKKDAAEKLGKRFAEEQPSIQVEDGMNEMLLQFQQLKQDGGGWKESEVLKNWVRDVKELTEVKKRMAELKMREEEIERRLRKAKIDDGFVKEAAPRLEATELGELGHSLQELCDDPNVKEEIFKLENFLASEETGTEIKELFRKNNEDGKMEELARHIGSYKLQFLAESAARLNEKLQNAKAGTQDNDLDSKGKVV